MNLENLELVNAWASGTPLGRQCTEPGRMSGLLAILLALPGLVFVALNVSYYELGLGFPGRLLESDVWNAMIVHEFAMPVLIGGTLLGFVFGARGVFCLPTRREKSAIIVERLVLNLYWLQWVAVSIASFVLLAFFSYLVFENMR